MAGADREELGKLLRLAGPLITASAGTQLMSFVDAAMVGRLGPASLGGVSVGNAIYFGFSMVGFGWVMGMDGLVAQAVGAGDLARAHRIFWQAVRIALFIGAPLTVAMAVAPLLLEPIGVDPATAREARRYLWSRLPNAIPFLLFAAQRSYLQVRGVTRPIVLAMVIANIANAAGNLVLIYGDPVLQKVGLPSLGLRPLGVVGAGLASTFATLTSVLLLAWAMRRRTPPGLPGGSRSADGALLRAITRQGAPIGGQLLAEIGVFAATSILAGRIGATAAAGHMVALTLASFTFTVCIGISSATSVRVGMHIGEGSTPAARQAGMLGMGAAAAFMTASALTFLFAPRALARILTDDPEVLAAAAPLVMVAAFFQISDGLQAVAAGALRGAGDTRFPLYANIVGHYFIGLPVMVGLGFYARWGAQGLWWGLSTGLTAVAIALSLRFHFLSLRSIKRL